MGFVSVNTADIPRRTPRVTIDGDGWIYFFDKRGQREPYAIEPNRILDADDLLIWIEHLTGKLWVDREIIGDFMHVVGRAQGIRIWGTKR